MKKGFSLIEILAVIVLLGIIITLASISVTAFRKNSEESLKNQKIKYIETGALRWGEDNLNSLNDGVVIQVNDLITSGYITGDNEEKDELLMPGEADTFNSKYVCVKYENVYGSNIGEESYMDAYGSVYYYSEKYNGITNYQVTAKYMGTTNSCN